MVNAAEVAQRYIAMWNDRDPASRRQRVAQLWATNGSFADPIAQGRGPDAIDEIVGGVQKQFAGCVFKLISEPDVVGSNVRVRWGLMPPEGPAVAKGTDMLSVASDKRLDHVVGYFDEVPTSQDNPGWSIGGWIGFWKNPDPQLYLRRMPTVVKADIVGYWPYGSIARGAHDYRDHILGLLALVLDLRLTLEQYSIDLTGAATTYFVRWKATATWSGKPTQCTGVDCIRVEAGKVAENRVFCDHEIFRVLADRMKARTPPHRRRVRLSLTTP